MVLFGQLKVLSDGKVTLPMINYCSNVTPRLAVSTCGDVGIDVKASPSSSSPTFGIKSYANASLYNVSQYCAGIRGYAGLSSSGSSVAAATFGVIGTAATPNDGSGFNRNFGVFGYPSSANGVGIFGATNFGYYAQSISQQYAGYFAGDVDITGTLKVNGVSVIASDYRYKENIADLNPKDTYNNVLKLNPVEYNLQQQYIDTYDTIGNPIRLGIYGEDAQVLQKKHYGLIAQELREIYPDLVYEDGNGYLSVDYVGIIPLLIQVIKEQNTRIETLEAISAQTIDFTGTSEQSAALYQNTPNPFSQSTEIKYYLPTSVNAAYLCIYDLNGKQLKQILLTARGDGSQIIPGLEFPAGIYLYALIADGKEIDAKRMILTE